MSFANRFRSRRASARLKSPVSRGPLDYLRVSGATGPIVVMLGFLAAAVSIVLSGEDRLPYVLNQTIDTPITARVSFERPNPTKTEQAREAARRATPSSFRLNTALLNAVAGDLRQAQTAVRAAENFDKFAAANASRWPIDRAAFDTLLRISGDDKPSNLPRPTTSSFDDLVERLLTKLARENLIQRPTAAERDPARESAEDVVLNRGNGPESVPKPRLSYASNEQHVTRLARELAEIFPAHLQKTVAQVITRAIRVDPAAEKYQPVFVFDAAATSAALEAAGRLSTVSDRYSRGDVLAPAGTRLSAEVLNLLAAEHESYMTARQTNLALYQPWLYRRIGEALLVMVITAGLALYTRRYQASVARHPTRCLSFSLLILSMLLLARLTVVQQLSELWAVATTATAACILTIVFSHRFAFGATTALAALTTLALNGSFELFLLMIAVGGILVFTLGDLRSRMRLIQVGLISALVAGAMAFAVGLTQEQALGFVATQAGIGAAATLLACCAVMVLLPVIERFFGVATSMTLLEWADTSSPLLRQLIQKAPGTWQHSHLLGSLAESAAEEIAANSLLVRVGAYYHDIGKMCKPEYFVENQSARQNVHNRLAPHMSLLVIVGHVKDGLALAVEHGLPRVLHQFIAEHHGTTLVKYFHHLAARQAERQRNGDRPIDDAEFRYPGPKPRTRESAILMLADSVEGAVRSLSEPTPSRIEAVVHEICMARLMDGQLDDCDITLKELARIEQSLVRSLCSIYHGRIAYPATEPEPDLVGQTRTA